MHQSLIETNGSSSYEKTEPIAIIGFASCFPGEARNNEALWDFLLQGKSAFGPFPEERINATGHYHPDPEHGGTFAVKGGHFLTDDPTLFDGTFFNTTKTEVLTLDPQQRVLLENVFHALENSGIPIEQVSGSNTSVYVSGFNHDYLSIINSDPESAVKYKPTGSSGALLSNRVSWFFNFTGPSITLDTACSSSMVALHLACQSLMTRESSMAIASGVSVILTPLDTISMGHHGFLSPEGKCFSFDHRADGYGRGEGVGTVVIKRLSDALRDGDTIRAIIRGSGVNQDGRTPGITLPSSSSQEELIRQVYTSAGLSTSDTAMVEAHGTGDPIEATALARAFDSANRKTELIVGAMKSSIGHLEGAAGIASVIKAVLILENGIIPPNANFELVNPKIPASKWKLHFPTTCKPWPSGSSKRISINSFGVGGTNAHIILDNTIQYLAGIGIEAEHCRKPNFQSAGMTEPALVKSENSAHKPALSNGNGAKTAYQRLLVFSSFDQMGIDRNFTALSKHLSSQDVEDSSVLDDLAYTLCNKRSRFPWRSFICASSLSHLTDQLQDSSNGPKPARVGKAPRLGFVFTGQGAQWAGMGKSLMHYSIFRDSLMSAASYFKNLGAQWSLIEELLAGPENSRISEPSFSQPLCTAVQIALVELLADWGIIPSRVLGHSSGEITAAFVAGKLSREAAWKVAFYRGVVSERILGVRGAMMASNLGTVELQSLIDQVKRESPGELTIACFNSPKNQTISGDEAKVQQLSDVLAANGIWSRRLRVSNAYHSAHMQIVAEQYLESLGELSRGISIKQAAVVMISTVTGTMINEDHLGADYWVQNLISPVRFSDAISVMGFDKLRSGQGSLRLNASAGNTEVDVIIEIGPHSALQSAIKETLSLSAGGSSIQYYPSIKRDEPNSCPVLLDTVGKLYCTGVPVIIDAVNANDQLKGKPRQLVDLPGYVFNHSERIWHESRLSANLRKRKFPRHDLLGAPAVDWNSDQPKWRHIIRLSEQPWLKDHVVTNSVVYPGVGYVIAILEACRQIAEDKSRITGFSFKHIAIKRALIVPDTREGVECSIMMSKMDESSHVGSSTWRKFQISSFDEGTAQWVEHCTGYVSIEYQALNVTLDAGREEKRQQQCWEDALSTAEKECISPLNFSNAYENLVTAGLNFGPLFRNLNEVKGVSDNSGQVLGIVSVPDVASIMPKKYMHSHLIHPATMDSMVHLFIASMMNLLDRNTLDRAYVPSFIKHIWISADITNETAHRFIGHGRAKFLAFDKYQSDVAVWSETTRELKVSFEGIKASPLDSIDSSKARKLCHRLEWVPDVDFLEPSVFQVDLGPPGYDLDYKSWVRKLQTSTLLLITDALDTLEKQKLRSFVGHRDRYFKWMLHLRELLQANKITGMEQSDWAYYSTRPDAKRELFDAVEAYNADGRLAVRMGSHIVQFLKEEMDPLYLMFQKDDLLDHVYQEVVRLGDLPAYQREYFTVVRKNSTNLRILELGAGTGSSTQIILDALCSTSDISDTSNVSCYTFTDLSSSFFEKAKDRFQDYSHIIEYRVLDIEKNPETQGFHADYDFVIAGNVVHATKDLVQTLANARRLLKPGGKLVLQEGVRQDFLWSAIAFGQLPGWWLGTESVRQWSPWVSLHQWNTFLKAAGFGEIELELGDRKDPDLHSQSIIVATEATSTMTTPQSLEVIIVTDYPESPLEKNLRDIILEQGVRSCLIKNVSELQDIDCSASLCVSTIELRQPLLYSLDEKQYLELRHWMCTCHSLLWVTGDSVKSPELNMVTGLIRTVRWERDLDNVNLSTLSVASPQPEEVELSKNIYRLMSHVFLKPQSRTNSEYRLESRTFLTARLFESDDGNNFLATKFSRLSPVLQQWGSIERPLKLTTVAPGLLNRMEFTTDPIYYVELEPTQIEIKIEAVGLNFRDLMIAMGEHMAYSLGSEGAGVVSRIGSDVTTVSVGDHVTYMCGIESTGCLHTYGRVDEKIVAKIPKDMPFKIAASLPVIYSTVIYGLQDIAKLQKGETVLIHAAAGGVGQAAVQYANLIGAEVYATCSTAEKRSLLIERYGVKEDHIFSSRDLDFVKGVLRMTNSRGVDVVLNSLAGEALRRSWDLVAPFGRFIEIGKKDAQMNGKIDLEPFLRNVTMASVELPTMMKHQPALIKRLIDETISLYQAGKIAAPHPITVMNYSQIEEGFRLLQSGKGMGKIVFKPHASDLVPVIPQQIEPFKLNSNATYVLAGGLGGIGRSLAGRFVSLGARSLVFLSRSGATSQAAQDLLADLKSKGCATKVFVCDVSDSARVEQVLQECRRTLPPIKGCVQGSMVLRDGMFENMSYSNFQEAVRPKVQGSWNLHLHLPKDLDFFLLLSSGTGILGNRSQANYATGNTYQDALAAHRHSLSLPASVLDLGTVLSVGYVAENLDKTMMARHLGTILEVLREDEVFALVEYLIDPRSGLSQSNCQIAAGLTDLRTYKQRGVPPPTYLSYPLFTHLNVESTSLSSRSGEGSTVYATQALLAAASSLEDASQIALEGIHSKLSSLLAIPKENIDVGKSVSSNGVDSLVAMEFRTFLVKDLLADVPLLEVMGTMSLEALGARVAAISKWVQVDGRSEEPKS